MRFLIAGSSGFLGTRLREHLIDHGHQVLRLVRGDAQGPDERSWAPYDAPLDPSVLEDVDVVVNLAGAPTLGNVHAKSWARELERSRVITTRVLADAIGSAHPRPVFLAGNGIAYYGDRGDQVLDESAPTRGDHLMTRVSRNWQDATAPAADAGARVVVLRTSPVLDRRSAPMNLLAPLFKLGLGGPLGSGKQWMPLIATADWVGAVRWCAEHDDVEGPVNLSLAKPTTNAGFTKALGRAVHRPALLPVPSFVLKPAAGPMAPELLGSVRAVPQALLDSGYAFAHPDVDSAVRAALAV